MTAATLFETGLTPLRDSIIVKRLPRPDETTPAGVIMPGKFLKKSIEGWVVAAGPGRRSAKNGELIPMRVKTGDRVLVDLLRGTNITLKGRDLTVMTDREVIAIIHDES